MEVVGSQHKNSRMQFYLQQPLLLSEIKEMEKMYGLKGNAGNFMR